MAASGVMMQQVSLTQSRQAPLRNPPVARLSGMPATQPQVLKVWSFMAFFALTKHMPTED